jgi:hypothetical protein
MPRDYRDYENELTPVKAHKVGYNTPITKEYYGDFVTTAIAAKIEAALDKGEIKFVMNDDPTMVIDPSERRWCPVYTIAGLPDTLAASDILGVMWGYAIDDPGTLAIEDGVLVFRRDPPPAPAPPPIVSAGDQMGAASLGKPPIVGVEGKMLQELLFNFRKTPGWVEFK